MKTSKLKSFLGFAVAVLVAIYCIPGFAEDSIVPQPAAPETKAPEGSVTAPVSPDVHDPNAIGPIVFTYWELAAIKDAKNSRGLVRPPTEAELMRGLGGADDKKQKPPPEEREIKLGGIAYVSAKDWTIWLNGQRVTPDAIPKEVLDLKVYEKYVEMKWLDDYTNQIFPLRLRPHQRFNIDTRIFLPG